MGQEDPLEKGMATHSSILAQRIPWTERSLVSYSPWGRKELDTMSDFHFTSLGRFVNCVHVQLFASPWTARHLVHGDSPGKNTGVGFHALLQGIFSTQGSNSGLLHCRQILYRVSDRKPKEMATHSSILARKTPWTEEPGRLQSMWWKRVGHD